MIPRKDRVKPTSYPVLIFHIVRSAQLISAVVVASILSYFLWQLHHDNYRLPWTFILLLTVALLTLLFLSATTFLHCFHGLNPLFNIALNSILFVLWALGFSLLTRWTSGTLAHVCNVKTWDDNTGIMICRIYKALFSFSLFGVISSLLALLLDIHVQRKTTQRGKFTALQPVDNKHAPSQHLPQEAEEANPNPMARRQQTGGAGYTALDADMPYDDTQYRGAAGHLSG
ncbi:uncharacterized protein EI97DRAFT_147251 [Westerdykella ornata]|uniref:MARVEL domain-containing protein n=1 Tax=Westerdykella ornata TaxID=318751 RepID=A0A6A6JBM9_WESOR|nr:uncharacterized protein EI97DRAFT_147251 [Westerdykella ornata]KAF2273614.1 hypothetical protein EI97DRAFT_147251 [Westerdykella ornata]